MSHQVFNLSSGIQDIVQWDCRTADVFQRYGISYCCGEELSLTEACLQNNIEEKKILRELEEATKTNPFPGKIQFSNWKISFLVDYIVNIHHAFLYQAMSALSGDLQKLCIKHKDLFPELPIVLELFNEASVLLPGHMRYQEEVIFPYIRQIENAYVRKEPYACLFVKTLRKPLHNMDEKHPRIFEIINELRKITDNYHLPSLACTMHFVVWTKLREIDNQFEQHSYMVNQVLFPRAIEMEKELLQ